MLPVFATDTGLTAPEGQLPGDTDRRATLCSVVKGLAVVGPCNEAYLG